MIWLAIFLTSLFWIVVGSTFLYWIARREDKEKIRWRTCAFKYMELFSVVCAEYEKQYEHLTALQNRDYISRN